MTSRKILYLEPIGGIAGDMFIAAGIDLGISAEEITRALAGLKLPGWRFSVRKDVRHSITGTRLDVDLEPGATGERTLTEILALIENASGIPARAKERARRVFHVIGEAEAKIHSLPLEQVHFHEVGAIDSIVDICGAAMVLELLGDPEVYAAPPPLGSGMSRSAHGPIPIPAPATLEILRDLPVRFEGVGELTTPTGAGLLKALCRMEAPPPLTVEGVGYGLGTKDFADRPNVLRASLGRAAGIVPPAIWVIEANLDDCSPQILGALVEELVEKGALDAFVLPATMKKGRPGHLLGAVVSADRKDVIAETLLAESTTLGIRSYPVERIELDRRFEEVETRYGRVRIKLGFRGSAVVNAQPEFEDCRRLARQHHVPVKEVQAEALACYRLGRPRAG